MTTEREQKESEAANVPPKHAFELSIKIGASTWEFALSALREIARHVEGCGPECGMVSGGWDGCYSVDIQKRDVTPEAYREELTAWSGLERKKC